MKRRDFIASVGAAAAVSALPRASLSNVQLGDFKLTTVSDGSLVLPAGFIFDPMPQDKLPALRESFGLTDDRLVSPCNVTVLQTGERTILFDVGSGQEFMDSAGELLDTLDEIGIAPDDVTDVVFTHAHPDHLWGLLDDFGDLMFADANYFMGAAEWDYWMNPNTVDEIGNARAAFAVGAKRRMEYIADQITLFKDGDEVLPGIAARATYGHTPGHMAFEVRSGSESAMVLGDCIGNPHVAFARPDWHSGSDQDFETAAKTRVGLLDQLAQEQMRIIGFHLPDGGMGRVERKDSAYQFVAEV